MSSAKEAQTTGALLALECIPPALRETLARDARMRDNYGIQLDTVLTVGDADFEAPVSAIAKGVGKALRGATRAVLRANDGNDWAIEADTEGDHPTLVFAHGDRQVGMHGWLTLSPERDTRLRCLEALATDAGLPPGACSSWRRILEERSLRGEEVPDFFEDLHATPHVQEQFLANSTGGRGLNPQLAAPPSRRYFERLVGSRGDSASIQCHAEAGARERLAELASWKPYEGFLQSLYMASHPAISEQVQVDGIGNQELVKAFEFILRAGDRVSQLGAIEVGLRLSADRPEVNPALSKLVELMREDDTAGNAGGFLTYSYLYVLVSSELSARQQLAGEPPFYRRLAALAQAGVIQRQMVAAGVALKDSVLDSMAGEYVLQALVDLRLEPRRLPALGSAQQLRAHFFGRIARAADRYENEVGADVIGKLRHVMGPEQLREAGDEFALYPPGPLEGPEESRTLPAEFAQAVEAQLDAETPATPADFAALKTSRASFSIGQAQADLVVGALERSDYRLAEVRDSSELLDTLASLASIAAIARSERLADTLRVVLRTSQRDVELRIALVDAMQVLLVAAASRADLGDWADLVGDCLTEFAFGDLTGDEGQLLHGYVRRLCKMAPELRATCGAADAALMAYNGSLASDQAAHHKALDS